MSKLFQRIDPYWQKTTWFLWLALVAFLPLSSFPLFAKVIRSSSVAPASGIFVIALAILWLPVYLFKNGRFPFQLKPALLFFLFSLFTVGVAFLRRLPDYKTVSPLNSALEAFATLGLGALFFVVTTALPNSPQRLRTTLAVINWSGLALILWSLVQVAVSFTLNDFTDGMRAFQHFFSTTVLFDRRATGFASEPSWLAHQLNLVYLMYWIAASLNRFTVHRFRIIRFTFENVLLLAGLAVLVLTFSRGGLVSFMLVLAFLFLLANVRLGRWLLTKWHVRRRFLTSFLTALFMFLVYLAIVLGGLFILSKLDPRMESVFQFSTGADNPILKYADDLQFGERVVYWQTGWNIFNHYPLTGVGVGFSGFYFPSFLPDYAWRLPEVNALYGWSGGLMNIKNLWTRLLAETGIIGFSIFVVFLLVMAFTALDLLKRQHPLQKTIGWMGLLMLIAFIFEEFSVDSFALPYYWFTLGLLAAAFRWIPPAERGSVGQV